MNSQSRRRNAGLVDLPDRGSPTRRITAVAAIVLLLVALVLGGATSVDSAALSCGRLQTLVDRAPAGSTLVVPRCIYRETVRIAKPLTLRTTGGEIRGSDVWSKWTSSAGRWVSARTVPLLSTYGPCRVGTTACLHPEQVFVNGRALKQVDGIPIRGQFGLTGGRQVVLAEDPAGKTVEVSTRTRWVDVRADHVTIDGFRMQHAANPPQGENGAILVRSASDFTLIRSTLSDVHGALIGIVGGSGHHILRNTLTHGGQAAFGLPDVRNTLVAGNRISSNNTEQFDAGWEAGAGKAGRAVNLVFDANDVYGNDGPGLWCDSGCAGVTFSNNRVHGNTSAGLLLEASDGANIYGNSVWSNGWGDPGWGWGAGIVISSSSNAQIHDNVVAWNADGISVVSQDRPGHTAIGGNYVYDNTIAIEPQANRLDDASLLGWLQDWDGSLFAPASNNRGSGNRYWSSAAEPSWARFVWAGSVSTLSEFNATPGEEGARYLSVQERDEVLIRAGIPTTPP